MRDTVEESTSTAIRERGGLGTEGGSNCTLSNNCSLPGSSCRCIIKLDMIYTVHRRMHMILRACVM